MNSFIIYVLLFIFGTAVGSFLNVVICRLETGEGVARGRSHCPQCGQVLRWYDLVPVISFFILRGRCRDCKKPISWQYPLVEAATGLIFVLIFNFQSSIFNEFSSSNYQIINSAVNFGFWFFIVSSCIVIFVYDLKYYIIPDKVLFPAIILSFIWRGFLSLKIGHWSLIGNWALVIDNFSSYLLSALGASAFFLFLVLITRGRGMGLGDAKLAVLMGLLLGWPDILVALFLAFMIGALVGLVLIAKGKKSLRSEVPFGPFLIGATLIMVFGGPAITDFCLDFLM